MRAEMEFVWFLPDDAQTDISDFYCLQCSQTVSQSARWPSLGGFC